jgi:hypothetical protein
MQDLGRTVMRKVGEVKVGRDVDSKVDSGIDSDVDPSSRIDIRIVVLGESM